MSTAREKYIQDYNTHHRAKGKSGSGDGDRSKVFALAQQAGYTDGMSVLDYGCGWGACSPYFTKYMGVDIAEAAIDLAQREFPERKFKVFEMGKLKVVPPKDFIISSSVFTHARIADVPDCLSDIKRNLKKTGVALLDFLEGSTREEGHIAYWKPEEFLQALTLANLHGEVIGVLPAPYGFTHTYLKVTHAQTT